MIQSRAASCSSHASTCHGNMMCMTNDSGQHCSWLLARCGAALLCHMDWECADAVLALLGPSWNGRGVSCYTGRGRVWPELISSGGLTWPHTPSPCIFTPEGRHQRGQLTQAACTCHPACVVVPLRWPCNPAVASHLQAVHNLLAATTVDDNCTVGSATILLHCWSLGSRPVMTGS